MLGKKVQKFGRKKQKKYVAFTMIEMLITMVIIAAIFLAIGSVMSNMIKTSNTVSSRMLIREEGEYLAEVFRKYLRNSSADNVRVYHRENPTITFDGYYGVSSLDGETIPPDLEHPATEIHFRPSGDATNKVVCMGFFKDGDKGYIIRTTNNLEGSWNDYDPERCFPDDPSSDQIFRKNFASLNSDLVYIEGLEIEQVRTATNVYYTIHIDMKPAWGLGGLSNYRDKDGAPKYRKSFVVQTRQLFYHAFRQRLGGIEIDETPSFDFDDPSFFFEIVSKNYYIGVDKVVEILLKGLSDDELLSLQCGTSEGEALWSGGFLPPRNLSFVWEDIVQGLNTLYCRVSDLDGITSVPDVVVGVFFDNIPPIEPTLIPSLIEGWSSSNIEISISGSTDEDEGSGLSHYEYCITEKNSECNPNIVGGKINPEDEDYEETVILEEDGEWKVCAVAVDNVGNRSPVVCSGDSAYKIDKTDPSLSATLASPTWFCAQRNPVVSATDEGSGLAQVRYHFGSSSPFDSDCTTGGVATSNGTTLNAPSGGTTLYLCARDNAGNVSSWSGTYNWKSPASAPGAPTMASNTSDTIILNGVSNGEYRRDGGTWQDSVTFSGLQPETSYSFTQRIKDEHCPSFESSSVSFSTLPLAPVCVVPSAPIGLSVSVYSETALNLSWSLPSDNGGCDIVGYRIERRTGSGSWSTIVGNTGNTNRTYRNTGLSENTQYTYRVAAINSEGVGANSNEATRITGHCYVTTGSCNSGYTSILGGSQSGCNTAGPVTSPYPGSSNRRYRIVSNNQGLTTSCSTAGTQTRTRQGQISTNSGSSYSFTGSTVNCRRCSRSTACRWFGRRIYIWGQCGAIWNTWYQYCPGHPYYSSRCACLSNYDNWDPPCSRNTGCSIHSWNRSCSDLSATLRWCCRQ